MQIVKIEPEMLKNLIKMRYNTLGDLANKLQIDLSTLSRKLKKPSRAFLIELKDAKVPIPDHFINPLVETVTAVISKDGVEGFMVKDKNEKYAKLLEEVKELKAENYDLKKQLEKKND